jgi:hypothetical protein
MGVAIKLKEEEGKEVRDLGIADGSKCLSSLSGHSENERREHGESYYETKGGPEDDSPAVRRKGGRVGSDG